MPDSTTLAVLAVPAVLVIAGLVFWLLRRGRRREESAAVYHFRCPGCKRRIRFLSRQVGHKGECSNCGKPVIFPPVSQSVD
jgi:hypothetical protein